MFSKRLLWSMTTAITLVLTAALFMPTTDVVLAKGKGKPPKVGTTTKTTGTAANNRCDQKHPNRGKDRKGHNNPKCRTTTTGTKTTGTKTTGTTTTGTKTTATTTTGTLTTGTTTTGTTTTGTTTTGTTTTGTTTTATTTTTTTTP